MTGRSTYTPPLRRQRLPPAEKVGVLVPPHYSPAQRARARVHLPELLAAIAAAPDPHEKP